MVVGHSFSAGIVIRIRRVRGILVGDGVDWIGLMRYDRAADDG